MRTRRTPAPRTSRPRATRLRGLVAALLTAPLALGTLAATALPAAAEPAEATISVTGPVTAGVPVDVTFTCRTDGMRGEIHYFAFDADGEVGPNGYVMDPAPSPDSTFSVTRSLTFPASGPWTLNMNCFPPHMGQSSVTVDVLDPAPVAEDTTTAIRFSQASVEPNNPINVEARVTGTSGAALGGTVQFSLRGQAVGGPVDVEANGEATTSIPNPGAGRWAVTAAYSGTESFNPSTVTQDVWVKAKSVVTASIPDRVHAPQTTLNASVVQAPDFPLPTGTITFQYSEGAVLGTVTLVSGAVVLPLPGLAPNTYDDVVAVYSGDENYSNASSTYRTMVVDPPLPTIPVKNASVVTVDVPAAVTGTQVPVKVTVEPGMQWTSMGVAAYRPPSGTVAITLGKGGPRQKVTLVEGTASVVFDGVAPGTYEVEASYAGDEYFEVASGHAPTTVTAPVVTPPVVTPPVVTPPVVTPPTPAPDLSGSTSTLPAGGTITLIARDFLPGETVSFYLHSDPIFLGTAIADANGVATLVVAIPANAPAGEHHVRATGATSLRTAEIPVTVTAAAPVVTAPVAAAPVAAPLASTGAEIGSTALLISVLLGSGALLLVGRRRFAPSAR